ncbi:MAG: hypothetical protein ABSB81_04845 [Halobacteriota archaeon]|jgi:hypothetical protein
MTGNRKPAKKRYYPFFGPEVSFQEAFPDIDDICVELQENLHEKKHYWLAKNSIGEVVPYCSNRLCHDGGFELGPLIRDMYAKKEVEREDLLICPGHEHMGSRWNTRRCVNYCTVRVSIKYRNRISH